MSNPPPRLATDPGTTTSSLTVVPAALGVLSDTKQKRYHESPPTSIGSASGGSACQSAWPNLAPGCAQGRFLARLDGDHERQGVLRITRLLQHGVEIDALPGQGGGNRGQDSRPVADDEAQVIGHGQAAPPANRAATRSTSSLTAVGVSASRSDTTATAVAGPPAPAPLKLLSPPYWP